MDPSEFDYELPAELIAQSAVHPKDSSRLMVVKDDSIDHKRFSDIVEFLHPGDVLVINETKVSRAKICGHKITGSAAELIICGEISGSRRRFHCRIKGNKVRKGNRYNFHGGLSCEILGQENDIFEVEFNKEITEEKIEEFFELPTPPYVKEKLSSDSDYQTVYANPGKTGSLAAPTAGLHFTEKLISKLEVKGVVIAKVCLHVDFGTFLPVRGKVEEHRMHVERYEVTEDSANAINERKGRLVCVGTTTVRTIESAADCSGKVCAGSGETGIFIYPGYQFKTKIDALVTNFHLPKSTLLMLVCAYFGREKIFRAYSEAVRERYRFFSLGDGMMLIKK
jgi:S-adenosylmethionine:tRNA ribosyltransferase-isomerase